MSRIGKQPIAVPPKVKVEVKGQKIFVEGPKGFGRNKNSGEGRPAAHRRPFDIGNLDRRARHKVRPVKLRIEAANQIRMRLRLFGDQFQDRFVFERRLL